MSFPLYLLSAAMLGAVVGFVAAAVLYSYRLDQARAEVRAYRRAYLSLCAWLDVLDATRADETPERAA